MMMRKEKEPSGSGLTTLRFLLVIVAIILAPAGSRAREDDAARPVVIPSHDGFELAARFREAGAPGAAVLLLHQCDREGEATGLEGIARGLARRGIHSLEVDLRGYGGSRSETFDGTNWQEAQAHHERDVEAAHRFLVSRPGVDGDRIGVLGASCGGRLGVALARNSPGIRALAFLSSGLGSAPAEFLGNARRLPMLCIAAEGDPFGRTVESMRVAFETSEDPASRLLMFKGSAHGAPLLVQEPHLEAAITGWFHDRLR